MRAMVFSVPSAIALGALATVSPWNRHRRHATSSEAVAHLPEPRTLWTILETREQLAEAAHRAANFERNVAERASRRAELYEALADGTSSLESSATVHQLPKGASDATRRSA